VTEAAATCVREWPQDRFIAGWKLLILLPTRPPGVPLENIMADLGIKRSALFRLLAALRAAGFTIERQLLDDATTWGYYFEPTNDFFRKIGLD
jgi:hypothetical protein